MNGSRILRATIAGVVAVSMSVGAVSTAHAADENVTPTARVADAPYSGAMPVSGLVREGFSIEEIERAVAESPYVSVGEAPAPKGMVSTQGVTFGKWIYVRISSDMAQAINNTSAVAAAGILGLVTGGVGAVVAAAVYTYVNSIGNARLAKCARWEFRVNYPAPFYPSTVRAAKCI